MKKQNGYINLDGFILVLIIFGVLIGIAICFVMPWLWQLVKPFIHAATS